MMVACSHNMFCLCHVVFLLIGNAISFFIFNLSGSPKTHMLKKNHKQEFGFKFIYKK